MKNMIEEHNYITKSMFNKLKFINKNKNKIIIFCSGRNYGKGWLNKYLKNNINYGKIKNKV